MNQSGRYGRYWQNASAGFVYGSRTGHRVGFQRTDHVAMWADAPHEPVVARFDYEYTGREHGAYVFEADSLKPRSELDYPRLSWDVEHATNASARLVVDDSGLIREFDMRVTLQEHGQTTSEGFRVHVTDVNQTRVTPPEWVDQAA